MYVPRLVLAVFAAAIFSFCPLRVSAQQAPATSSDERRPIISSVSFKGNHLFSDEQLLVRVRTRPNRRFLNLPGVTPWLWLYRAGASGSFGNRIGRSLMVSGEAPAYLDSTVVAADLERLRLFYQQEGFRSASVEARIDTSRQGGRAGIQYEIRAGDPTYLRRVEYEGLGALSGAQRNRLLQTSLLAPARMDTVDDVLRPAGRRYSEPVLVEERRRIISFLRDRGFAGVSRDSIRAVVFEAGTDSFDVSFDIRTGPEYRFGDLVFQITGPEHSGTVEELSLPRADGEVLVRKESESGLDPSVIRRALRIEPGDVYDQSRLLATKRRLDATGLFTFSNIIPQPADTVGSDSAAVLRLPHVFALQTRRRHSLRVETFVEQRSGVIGGSDNEVGTGAAVTYQNANALGGGEVFQIRLGGSLAATADAGGSDSTLTSSGFFGAAQAEITTSLVTPYLVAPFNLLDRALGLPEARTRFTFSLLTARREDLRLIIRGRGALRARLELDHTPTLTSLIDIPDVALSNPDTLSGFRRSILNPILIDSIIAANADGQVMPDTIWLVSDPVQRAQIIEDYTRPQVNSAFRYTLRSSTVNPLRREEGYSYETSFEVGNNLPYLLDRFVFSPDSVEGSIPGLPFFGGGRASRLGYRPYVRVLTDLRRYRRLTPGRVFATRFNGGYTQPTGQTHLIPFDRRFYSGGATSVRGWELRRLGPGPTTSVQGGEIKLEVNAELRNILLRNVLGANWAGALFSDAGNVWLGPASPGDPAGRFRFNRFYKEIGVGAGFGLRVDWEYLILRFDLAYKIYDPARPGAGALPDGLGRPMAHFGIGHAF